MNRAAVLAILAAAAMGGPPLPTARPLPAARPPRKPPAPTGTVSVACPRCGAEAGEDCDKRTLGAHWYHMARVLAHKETT